MRKGKGEAYFVTLIHQLMSARNQLQAVDVVEFAGDLVSEQPSGASGTDGPRVDLLGVAPHEIAKGAFVRDLLGAGYDSDLVEGADFGRQAAVHAKHFAVDDCGQGQKVKDLAAGFPDRGVAVFGLAFFVEAVDLGDLAGFVVSADEGDAVWESALVREFGWLGRSKEGNGGGSTHFAFKHMSRVNVSKLK